MPILRAEESAAGITMFDPQSTIGNQQHPYGSIVTYSCPILHVFNGTTSGILTSKCYGPFGWDRPRNFSKCMYQGKHASVAYCLSMIKSLSLAGCTRLFGYYTKYSTLFQIILQSVNENSWLTQMAQTLCCLTPCPWWTRKDCAASMDSPYPW